MNLIISRNVVLVSISVYTTAYYRQMCIYLCILLDYEFIDFGNSVEIQFKHQLMATTSQGLCTILWLNEQTFCLLLLHLWVWQDVSKCKGNLTQRGKCCKIYKRIKKGMNGSAGYGVMVVTLGKASRCEVWTGQELEQTAHTWSWQSRLC